MGVDPVELQENPRLFKTKKVPKNSRHALGVDPIELQENPDHLLKISFSPK